MSVFDRAEEDLKSGDLGAARNRLASHLNSKGYDDELLQRLGRMSFEMRDLAQAGRYWLASCAAGEDVELCVGAFLRRVGSSPSTLVAQLPRVVRLQPFDALAPSAQNRMRRFGLEDAHRKWLAARHSTPMKTVGKLVTLGLLAFVTCIVVIGVIGVLTIVRWVFPGSW